MPTCSCPRPGGCNCRRPPGYRSGRRLGECRHCGRLLRLYNLRLCWFCYYRAGVRGRYAPWPHAAGAAAT
jgi:hypothetical protein